MIFVRTTLTAGLLADKSIKDQVQYAVVAILHVSKW